MTLDEAFPNGIELIEVRRITPEELIAEEDPMDEVGTCGDCPACRARRAASRRRRLLATPVNFTTGDLA